METNSPNGYTIAINTKTAETSLTSETTNDKILATTGTVAEPKILTANTWGFSLDAEDGTSPTIGSKFAGVTAEPIVFYESDKPNYEAEAVKVYFAANVAEETAAGTYNNIVVYTVTSKTDVSTIPAPTIDALTPTYGAVTGGTRVTITGDNYTYNGSSITTKVTIGGEECTDAVVLHDETTEKDTITCTAPAQDGSPDTRVDVEVTTWGGKATAEDAFRYDVSDLVYVTPDIASTTSGTETGPAFTIYGLGFVDEEYPVSDVKIGGVSCEEFKVVSNTQITCTKGPNSGLSAGEKAVVVYHTAADGTMYRSGGNLKVTYYNSDLTTGVAFPTFVDGMTCTETKTIYRDTRDSQLYYVAKMADGRCWMVDNLKYAGTDAGTLSQVAGKALSNDGTNASTAGNYTVAKYVDPNTQEYCMGTTNMPAQTVTRCGMYYNWYAATAGTGNDSLTTLGQNASGSICPAGMKLPSSIVGNSYGEVSSFATADYPVLVASLKAGTVTAGVKSDDSAAWQASLLYNADWNGVYGGFWSANWAKVSQQAYYWSSPVAVKTDSKLRAHYLSFHSGEVRTGDGSYANDTRNYGFAVRCVEE